MCLTDLGMHHCTASQIKHPHPPQSPCYCIITMHKCMLPFNRPQAQFALYWNHQSYPGYDVKSIMPIASTTHHNTHDKTHPKWAQHQQDSIKICPIISQILRSRMQHCNA